MTASVKQAQARQPEGSMTHLFGAIDPTSESHSFRNLAFVLHCLAAAAHLKSNAPYSSSVDHALNLAETQSWPSPGAVRNQHARWRNAECHACKEKATASNEQNA
mmetsp:Transcript_54404/g.164746  ORF Transcript_54404/g.164746 Transcript_54404/m.164746 type:complete len:105 (+) Transcript_54404:43-357(+)